MASSSLQPVASKDDDSLHEKDKQLDRTLKILYHVINDNADTLNAERKQRATVSKEFDAKLRSQEASLIKHFAHLLYLRHEHNKQLSGTASASEQRKCSVGNAALTEQRNTLADTEKFLKVINISEASIRQLLPLIPDLSHTALSMSNSELTTTCQMRAIPSEEQRRVVTAFKYLGEYTKLWIERGTEPMDVDDKQLSWQSYDPNFDVEPDQPGPSTASTMATVPVLRQYLDHDRPNQGANQQNRRSISESGADSGASDSGVSSNPNVSQSSLPTTTPPASPGYLSSLSCRYNEKGEFIDPTTGVASVSRKNSTRGSQKRAKTPPSLLRWKLPQKKNTPRGRSTNPTGAGPSTPTTPSTSAIQSSMGGTVSTPSRATGPSALTASNAPTSSIQRSRSAESNVSHRIQPGQGTNNVNAVRQPYGGNGGNGADRSMLIPGTAEGIGLSSGMSLSRSEHSIVTSTAAADTTIQPLPVQQRSRMLSATSGSPSPRRSPDSVQSPSPFQFYSQLLSPTSPGPTTHGVGMSPSATTHFDYNKGTPQAPRSPTATRITHNVPHKWQTRHYTILKHRHLCEACRKLLTGTFNHKYFKCESCKIRVHSTAECQAKVANMCGFTQDHLNVMVGKIMEIDAGGWNSPPVATSSTGDTSTSTAAQRSMASSLSMPRIDEQNVVNAQSGTPTSVGNVGRFAYPPTIVMGGVADVDSSSSANSSAPGTPAHYKVPHTTTAHGHDGLPYQSSPRQFVFFPDEANIPSINEPKDDLSPLVKSDGSDLTMKVSSHGSQALSDYSFEDPNLTSTTLSVDSQTSSQSHQQHQQRPDRSDPDVSSTDQENGSDQSGTGTGLGPGIRRNDPLRNTIKEPSSWSEITIPLDRIHKLDDKDALIGVGRFGPVYKGYCCQDVAVKFLNMDHVEESKQLTEFKKEVMDDYGVEITFPRPSDPNPNLVMISGQSEDAVYDCIDHLRNQEEEFMQDFVERTQYMSPSSRDTNDKVQVEEKNIEFVNAPWQPPDMSSNDDFPSMGGDGPAPAATNNNTIGGAWGARR